VLHSSVDDYFATKIHELCQALSHCTDIGAEDQLALELETILHKFYRHRNRTIKQ